MNDESVLKLSTELSQVGERFYSKNWCLATSSNFSVVLKPEPFELLITVSGRHKGRLGPHDFMIVDQHGKGISADSPQPSAETALHLWASQVQNAGAILHTHSPAATVLSEKTKEDHLKFSGYEMLKAFQSIKTHDSTIEVPIFENTQDISGLAKEIEERFQQNPHFPPCFILKKHGLYAWGETIPDAERHIECIEFLLECRLLEQR